MKQSAGFAVIVAVSVAAMRLTGGADGAVRAPAAETVQASSVVEAPKVAAAAYRAGCTAYGGEAPGTTTHGRGGARALLDIFFGLDPAQEAAAQMKEQQEVRYAIVLAPDPVHTNLGLVFDREMVAVQQAAQDDGYTYDSSWLPWKGASSKYPLLADQQRADESASHREACPGMLLFRKSLTDGGGGGSDSYGSALIVLVVGEQPTGGVNEDQWANALHWLANHASPEISAQEEAGAKGRTLRILGPSFSGSLVSLNRELTQVYRDGADADSESSQLKTLFPRVRIFSGGVSSCSAVHWFHRQLADDKLSSTIQFGAFQENDELHIYRFFSYLKALGGDVRDTAVLSEDETAYGYHPSDPQDETGKGAASCDFAYADDNRPLRLAYPRDISALRTAYEKQSVFDGPTRSGGIHPVLKVDDGKESDSTNSSDTIRAYAGSMSAVTQEAVLYGAVSYLRAHHTRYLLLRCTNPLDFLFLTRFFHRAYPEVRIVTVGSDLLFRRAIDTTEFRGVMSLTNYPLLPMNQHWSQLSAVDGGSPSHVHRVFESHIPAGTYVAARYLFNQATPMDEPSRKAGEDDDEAIVLPWLENVPDYADPFWLHPPGSKLPETLAAPTWLVVVGRDGYWPVAVLNRETTPPVRLDGGLQAMPPPQSTLVRVNREKAHYKGGRSGDLDHFLPLKLPLSWRICVSCTLVLLIYQAFGMTTGAQYAYSTGLFSVFRRFDSASQALLLGTSCAFAAMLLLALLSILWPVPGATLFEEEAVEFLFYGVGLPVLFLAFFTGSHWKSRSLQKRAVDAHAWCAPWAFGFLLLLSMAVAFLAFHFSLLSANSIPVFYRMSDLTAGVSPLLPLIFLISGMYLWTWQALAGNTLLHCGRPQLPKLSGENKAFGWVNRLYLKYVVDVPLTSTETGMNRLGRSRYRMSFEMGKRIVDTCSPVSLGVNVVGVPALLAGAALLFFHHDLPLLGLESHAYAVCFNLALLFAFFLTSCEAARLFWTWREFKRLLTELSRQRFRRTFAKLRAVDANSLWSVSGDAYRVQYHFFSQQLDAVIRLSNHMKDALPCVLITAECGREFARLNASRISDGPKWDEAFPIPGSTVKVNIRSLFADTTAEVFNTILLPAWLKETTSLSLENSAAGPNEKERHVFDMELSQDETVRAAEEFVCFQYIAFIQNILARMRTMVLSMVYLFLAVCFAISFYPFVPRTQIGLWMMVNLLLIGSSVIYVYAGMERDETLSYIANTRPGHLSGEFWLKTLGFLAGPLIGVLTTQFPSIAESVLGWLQPGLDAIK